MDWRAKVELFEEIRREYEFGIGTIAGVAKKLKVHRRMVREAIGSALPVPRKKTERPRWKLAGAVAFVDGILESDRKAPRKQRHTAHRIWERMRTGRCQIGRCRRTRSISSFSLWASGHEQFAVFAGPFHLLFFNL